MKNLKGHQKAVTSLVFSPDDRTLASRSNDRTIKLWDINKAVSIYTFIECSAEIQSVAISSDGNLLIAGGFDRRITAWYLENKSIFCSFFGSINSPKSHLGAICQVAIEKEKRFIISGSTDTKVRVWHGYTGELKRTLNEHSGTVWSVSISPSGEFLASADAVEVKLWNLMTGQLTERVLGCHPVSFNSDGKFLATGDYDRGIKIWSRKVGQSLTAFFTESNC